MLLSDRHWKTLIKDLQQQRCILLLGNRVAVAANREDRGERLPVLLARHLARQLEAEQIPFERDQTDHLAYIAQRFLAIPKIRRIDLEDEVIDFYNAHTRQVPEFYTRLAKLPFTLSVNLSPDDYLARAMRAAGKTAVQTAHYNFRKERNLPIETPGIGKPLVYNLVGALSDPESLVLTQEDRVEFIKNVVKGNPDIPNAIMSHFDERKTYIFLGLNLENWDYRLLFDTLKLSRENLSFLPQPGSQPISSEARSYFEDRYRVMFIETGVEAFIENLERQYAETVAESPAAPVAPKRVVVLFGRNEPDIRFTHTLSAHLSSWIQRGILDLWHAEMPQTGDLDGETRRRLASADAVLPVLSADFWADGKMTAEWLPEALRQHRERGALIVPLLHRACAFEETELAVFPVLPAGNKPLRNWPDEDEAFKNIVDHLKRLLYD